jgi:hypothetical protein
MSQEDRALSMRLSPRAARAEDNDDLRSLLVHRLPPADLAVWRRALRTDKAALHCEPCRRWEQLPDGEAAPAEWQCPACDRRYGIEFAVYAELDDDDG